jgi:Flp pilus assembly protein TadG
MRGSRSGRRAQEGQALVLFCLMGMAILFMAAILFDAAQAIVHRRLLQNAADAGALSAANLLQSGDPAGCSGSVSGGTARSSVQTAAANAVTANLPAGTSVTLTVTCPSGYNDGAVKVNVSGASPSFFAAGLNIVLSASQTAQWSNGVAVSANASAIYGGNVPGKFSVVLLNPYNSGWQSGKQGCPSMLFSGGPTVYFEGSVQVDSACPAANNGAMSTNGNSATLTFATGAKASLVGGFSPGPLVVTPSPLTGQPVIKDPLRTLPAVPVSLLPVRSTIPYVLNNTTAVLEPGIYQGGIQLKNTSQAFLRPGIYVIDNGGVDIGAQAAFFSISSSATSSSISTWDTDCLKDSCGVLIYIKNADSNGESFSVGAGGTVMLRPYTEQADRNGTNMRAFRNLLMWQDKTPVPGSNSIQPALTLNGGGTLSMRGTLYAPSAMVLLTGGAGGSGGNTLDLTVQFIAWDLQIQGNSHFNFYYRSNDFAQPIQYGLVE